MPGFLAGSEVGKFPSVTHQIPKLADVCWWNEAPGDKIVLEDVCDPLSVPLIRFLPSNCFHILGVSKDNIAGALQNVVDGNPILPCGLHTDIPATILSQPCCTPMQISGEGRKPLAFVACHTLLIGGSNAGNDKGFVDIHPTADGVNDFEQITHPLETIFEGTGRDWTLAERLK